MFDKKIILVGAGASGKDYFRQNFQKYVGLNFSLSCTTREPREGEIDGIDYRFLSKDIFESMINFGNMLQYAEFNGEYYGTTKDDFQKYNLFIMSPDGISQMSDKERELCNVIYVCSDKEIMYNRFVKRGMSDEDIKKRMDSDDVLFNNFTDYDFIIINNG